jgi:exopolysaccharide biosynthesis polyprenyl glycosylphosphotransferase
MLAGADLISLLCFCGSLALFSNGGWELSAWSLALLPVWFLLAKVQGLYDSDHRTLRHLTVDELGTLFIWTVLTTLGTVAFLSVTPQDGLSQVGAVGAWAIFFVAAVTTRAATRGIWRRTTPPERTAIIGSGFLADATRRKLELFSDIHADLVAYIPSCTSEELRESPTWLKGLDRIILATESLEEPLLAELIATCRVRKIKLAIVPPGHSQLGTAVRLTQVADLHLLDYNTWDVSRSTLLLKRAIDVIASALGLILLSPFFAAIAVVIAFDSGRPIFYRQRRAGLQGRPFMMIKFRTMVVDADARLSEFLDFDDLDEPMFKLKDDPRRTRVGRLLRRLSLDELPQLWNVLGGQMSLVGPRPEQMELVERYEPQHRFRLLVKPGMTGPMQVYGRSDLTFEERLALERDYVENLTVLHDLRIMAMTVVPVFQRRGAT